MKQTYKIFCINPGSTSTKIALFEDDKMVFSQSVSHDAAILKTFDDVSEQLPYRKQTILDLIAEEGITLEDIDAFSCMAGGFASLEGGTYPINEKVLEHARIGFSIKNHPALLGSQLAHEFSTIYGGQAFFVDPPDVDEFEVIARITGFADIFRESRCHSLNQKEIARRHAASLGKRYDELNLVVAHMGGGVSVSAHKNGRIIDSTDVAQGDGPLTPTRPGALPATPLIKQCFSGKYTEKQMLDRIIKTGGFVEHLGTADVLEVQERIEKGDKLAALIFDAFAYQVSKNIGAYATVLEGKVDAVLLTGGIARAKALTDKITKSVSFIAPVTVYGGEFELEALAAGALRVLRGEEQPKNYTGVPIWEGLDVN